MKATVHSDENFAFEYSEKISKTGIAIREAVTRNKHYIPNDLGALLDDFYSLYEAFCGALDTIDLKTTDAFEDIYQAIEDVCCEEAATWIMLREIQASFEDKGYSSEYREKLYAILRAFTVKRTKPSIILSRLRSQRESLFGEPKGSRVITIGFIEAVARLVEADELEEEELLTKLLLDHEDELAKFLTDAERTKSFTVFIDRMWYLADILVQYCMYLWHIQHRIDDWKIIAAFASEPINDKRFGWLLEILSEYDMEKIVHIIERANSCDSGDSRNLLLRCLVIGHPSRKIRRFAAENLRFDPDDKYSLGSTGRLIARSRVPVDTLVNIGIILEVGRSTEKKRLFFDCTRRRIADEIKYADGISVVIDLAKYFTVLFGFRCLSDDGYYDRFRRIFDDFMECADEYGFKPEDLNKLFYEFESERMQSIGLCSDCASRYGMFAPKVIKRKLAAEPPYALLFVSDVDTRIALETIPNINRSNIRKALAKPEIQELVLRRIIEVRGRMVFSGSVMALKDILMHCKCPIDKVPALLAMFPKSRYANVILREISLGASRNQVRNIVRSKLS